MPEMAELENAGQGRVICLRRYGALNIVHKRGWCLPCVTHLLRQCLTGISVSAAHVSACISHPSPDLWPGTMGAFVEPHFQGLS